MRGISGHMMQPCNHAQRCQCAFTHGGLPRRRLVASALVVFPADIVRTRINLHTSP
jgi:hypothetical protein